MDVFGLHANEVPDAVRRSRVAEHPRLGFKREFAGLLRAKAKQVPRGRAWYLHRFALSASASRLRAVPWLIHTATGSRPGD